MNRKRLRYLAYLFFACVMGAVAAVGTYNVFGVGMLVTVPNLKGSTISEAETALRSVGLSMVVTGKARSAEVAEGRVLRQYAGPGASVPLKGVVHVVESTGTAVITVPSIMGRSIEEAAQILRARGAGIGRTIAVHSDSVDRGMVIAQSPPPEEKSGGPVSVIVSAGPWERVYVCPTFVGLSYEDAFGLAVALGIELDATGQATVGVEVGRQRPEPGARIRKGDTVSVELVRARSGEDPAAGGGDAQENKDTSPTGGTSL